MTTSSTSGSMLSDATGSSNLQELIECPICYLQYDRPLQLTCGHTFCASCVDRLVENARPNSGIRDRSELAAALEIDPWRDYDYIYRAEQRLLDGHQVGPIVGGMQELVTLEVPPVVEYPLRENSNRFDPRHAPIVQIHQRARRGGGTCIRCPECRKPTYVPADGLPVNYRLQQMITRMAENSHGNSATTETKLESLETIRCQLCEDPLSGGIYFSCKNCQESEQLCSTCCIRKHNGHDIEEKRALTDRDLKDTKERIGAQTGRAFHVIDQLQARLGQLTSDARDIIEKLLQDSVHSFEVIAAGLDTMQGNSLQTLEVKTGQATQLADKYDEMLNKVDAIVIASRERCEILAVDFREFVRELGVEMKREPNEDNSDVIVLDYPTSVPMEQTNDASNPPPDSTIPPSSNPQPNDSGIPSRRFDSGRVRHRNIRDQLMIDDRFRRLCQMRMRGRENSGVGSNFSHMHMLPTSGLQQVATQMPQNPGIQQLPGRAQMNSWQNPLTRPCMNPMFGGGYLVPIGYPGHHGNPYFNANLTRGVLNVGNGPIPQQPNYPGLPVPPTATERSQIAGDVAPVSSNEQSADSRSEVNRDPTGDNSGNRSVNELQRRAERLIITPRRRGQSRVETEEAGRIDNDSLRDRRWRRQDNETQTNSSASPNLVSPTTSPPVAKKKIRYLPSELNRPMPARTHVEGTSARTRAMTDTIPTASTSQVETELMNRIILRSSSNSNNREQAVEEGDMNVQGDADTESED